MSYDRSDKVFCRRKSDGKYYRGSYFFTWVRSWRWAAVLPKGFWLDNVQGSARFLAAGVVEYVGLNEIDLMQ